ncbi:OmpA family protein [Methylobacterium nigriterrae]|uniref:OmpA family protein n=1 Tax=Methylobacterium nigriterrae TaxID=3127512 RepID=UPI00301398CF
MRTTRLLLLTGTILPGLILTGPLLARPADGITGTILLAQAGPGGEREPRGEGPRGGEAPRGGPPAGARPERGPPERAPAERPERAAPPARPDRPEPRQERPEPRPDRAAPERAPERSAPRPAERAPEARPERAPDRPAPRQERPEPREDRAPARPDREPAERAAPPAARERAPDRPTAPERPAAPDRREAPDRRPAAPGAAPAERQNPSAAPTPQRGAPEQQRAAPEPTRPQGQPQQGQPQTAPNTAPGVPGRPVAPPAAAPAQPTPGAAPNTQPGVPGRPVAPAERAAPPATAPGTPPAAPAAPPAAAPPATAPNAQPGVPGRPVQAPNAGQPGTGPGLPAGRVDDRGGDRFNMPGRPGYVPGGFREDDEDVRDYDRIRRDRREFNEDGRTYIREPGRIIVRDRDGYFIRHDENERFRDLDRGRYRSERRAGETVTYLERPGGEVIVTVVDDDGRLLRRSRRFRDGREVVLIDNAYGGRPRPIYEDVVDLPPPDIRIPRERYVVEYDRADERAVYEALSAPPVVPIDRRYTLDQVRYSPQLRARMRSVDIDTINFDTGSFTVTPDQAARLATIAAAINQAIRANSQEVFLIEGYTDAAGNDVDNLSLSDRRAQSVATVLTQRFQVPPENLTTQGYGEQYLKVNTQNAARENRRVTVRRITPLIQPGEAQGQPPR